MFLQVKTGTRRNAHGFSSIPYDSLELKHSLLFWRKSWHFQSGIHSRSQIGSHCQGINVFGKQDSMNKHLKVHGVHEAANVHDVIHLCRTILCKTPKNDMGNGEDATNLASSRITPFLLASQCASVSGPACASCLALPCPLCVCCALTKTLYVKTFFIWVYIMYKHV